MHNLAIKNLWDLLMEQYAWIATLFVPSQIVCHTSLLPSTLFAPPVEFHINYLLPYIKVEIDPWALIAYGASMNHSSAFHHFDELNVNVWFGLNVMLQADLFHPLFGTKPVIQWWPNWLAVMKCLSCSSPYPCIKLFSIYVIITLLAVLSLLSWLLR